MRRYPEEIRRVLGEGCAGIIGISARRQQRRTEQNYRPANYRQRADPRQRLRHSHLLIASLRTRARRFIQSTPGV